MFCRLEKYEGGHQHQLHDDLQQERNRCQSLEIEVCSNFQLAQVECKEY